MSVLLQKILAAKVRITRIYVTPIKLENPPWRFRNYDLVIVLSVSLIACTH
jgi:hypothetical protein